MTAATPPSAGANPTASSASGMDADGMPTTAREAVGAAHYGDGPKRERVSYRALQGQEPSPRYKTAPLRKGGWCVFKRSGDTRPLEVVAIVGGVAKVARDGRSWEEPAVCLKGVRI
jgi:hypothetical protein